MGGSFVLDYTERLRRISEGIAILQLLSGDEITVQIPTEDEIVVTLDRPVQRFYAFDLLCEFVRRARSENHPNVADFRKAALRVAGVDPTKVVVGSR
jgi:antitoxin component of MazEF toxin-antitoxin module